MGTFARWAGMVAHFVGTVPLFVGMADILEVVPVLLDKDSWAGKILWLGPVLGRAGIHLVVVAL